MHILYTIGSLKGSGGVERVLVNKANYLSQLAGYRVSIIVADNGLYTLPYVLKEKMNIVYLNINQYDNYCTSIPILGFFYKAHKLKRIYTDIIKDLNVDVIVNVERGFEDFIIPKLSERYIKIRESHSSLQAVELMNANSTSNIKERFFTYLYSRQLKKFDKVVLLTEQDRIYRNYPNGDVYIPNLITKFSLNPNYDVSSRAVISVGRLDKYKNFAVQIEVWKQVVIKHPEWQLHIYGNGPEKESLQQLIVDLQLEKSVFLQGTSTEIEKKLQTSAFFLFTSIAEGFGMVLVEAMQMGLPVIAYDCPCGPKDIISHNEDGFLIELNNKNELEKAIFYLIAHPEIRVEMSKNAVSKSKKYLAEQIMPQWLGLFNRMKNEKH